MTSIQEMQWVLRAQCRDRDAIEALLRSVQPSLRRYLSGIAGTTDVIPARDRARIAQVTMALVVAFRLIH